MRITKVTYAVNPKTTVCVDVSDFLDDVERLQYSDPKLARCIEIFIGEDVTEEDFGSKWQELREFLAGRSETYYGWVRADSQSPSSNLILNPNLLDEMLKLSA